MARHIFIDRDKRKNKSNVQEMYDECFKTLQAGNSIFIFPQGTVGWTEGYPLRMEPLILRYNLKFPSYLYPYIFRIMHGIVPIR
jgi:1-acyl-sn-glycerol-3-phosphate acyltransferase